MGRAEEVSRGCSCKRTQRWSIEDPLFCPVTNTPSRVGADQAAEEESRP